MAKFGGAGLRRRRAAGAGLAGAVAAAVVLAGALVPMAATAAPGDQSASSSRFLSGSLLLGGVPLDDVVALGGSSTSNAGSPTPDTETSSLDLTALNALQLGIPGGLSVPLSNFVQLGAVNQYSQSSDAGVSRAAAGAVSDSGVIDTTGTGAYPSNASFNLQGLLGSAVTGTVADLDISLEAISSEVAIDSAGAVTRDYNVAGGDVALSLPAIATLTNTLTGPGGVTATVDAAVASLAGPSGLLAQALAGLNAALAPIVGNDGVNITITTDIAAAMNTILDTPVGDGVVSVNLRTGLVTADIAALFSDTTGRGLNNLNVGEEVLSAAVLNNLITRVGNVLNTVPNLVQTALTNTLNAAVLNIGVAVCVVGTAPTCTTPVVDIGTGLQVSVPNQTLGSVVAGTATATISLKVAGLPVVVPVGTLLGALTTPINATLFGPTGVIATVVPTVTTAVTGIITAIAPAVGLLNGVVSLRGNVQSDNGPIFSEEAFVLTVGDILGTGGVGTIALARAQAGPNALADAPTVDAAATVQAGDDLAVTGAGWPANTEVSVQLTAPGGGANVGGPETVTTDGTGGFTLAYPVPASAAAGTGYTVTATAGAQTATDTIDVTAAATVDADDTVQAGSDLGITGANWPANTEVTVQLTAPGGGANVGGPETVTTDATGGFTLAYPVPAGTPAGTGYTVTATVGAQTATDTTAVTAAPTVDAADTVEAGSSLSVTGSDWPADTEVTVQLTAPGGAPIGTPQTTTTSGLGGFTLAYPVPAGTPAGTGYTVTATAGAATAVDTTEVTAAPVVLDAAASVPAGTNLAVTGSGWPVNATVSLQLTAPGGGANVGGPVNATTDAFGAFSVNYPVPADTAPATGYTLTGTSGAVTQTDTVEVTAGDPADVNTNAAASASASADATADGDPSAQAAAEAAALADATSAASAAATADASAAAVSAATTDASTTATTDATAAANASAAVAAQAAAQADASDDANAAASTAADANSAASSESAATADSSTNASSEASTNANASASASASANADASTDAVAEAAAQAAAWADATAEGSAAANPAAAAAAQTAATATSSTDATADATSAANAGAAVAAQAAALADATSTTAAQASATSDASTSAASNASAAALASASTDASSDAVASADADADPSAEVNTNASASAAASAQADSDANAVAEAAAVAAALADATSSASAAADVTADAAASAAATTDASTDASSTATTDANASAAAAAQAAAQTDATSTSAADASAAATANANASSAAAANASSSATASSSAAADVSADATAEVSATATSTASASASADGNAAANPGAQIGIRVVTPVLERGDQQTAIGTGFQPGETVTGLMTSAPLALGSRIANAQGEVTFTWTIPADTDLGTHTVTLTGATSGAVSTTFQVVASGLATTGGDVQTGWVALAALLLLMGLGAVRLGRRRAQTVAADRMVE